MAAKVKTNFVCQSCSHQSSKWLGKCPNCNEWNTLVEEITKHSTSSNKQKKATAVRLNQVEALNIQRIILKDQELNRTLGGGLIPGSVVLFGGEPGIGKSTLLLQVALQNSNLKVLYVSGEESAQQIKVRAERINTIQPESLYILPEIIVENILETAGELRPDIIIIDSIQTLQSNAIESSAGSVSQVRECANELIHFSKQYNIPCFLVGHITKEGSLAGPKILEHMVDTVLQFEGDRNHLYRMLRTTKNRFGSTNELGIYEMKSSGLQAVDNPSNILLEMRDKGFSGIAIAANIEGIRPIFIETQALVSKSAYGTPQRSATGFDLRRLNMLLAVLEKKCGFKMGLEDVFLNITGGIKIEDPASDLAVALAIISSKLDLPIPADICCAGEIGLSGEIRPIQKIEARIKEAEKLGFKKILLSKYSDKEGIQKSKIEILTFGKIQEVFAAVFKP